jgi:hypothetical protein
VRQLKLTAKVGSRRCIGREYETEDRVCFNILGSYPAVDHLADEVELARTIESRDVHRVVAWPTERRTAFPESERISGSCIHLSARTSNHP